MTQDQAGQTRCCGPDDCGYRNPSSGDRWCIGAHCMAWRILETAYFRVQADAEYRSTGKRISPTDGYCGLAGKP